MLTELAHAQQIIQKFKSWKKRTSDKPLNNFADIIMLADYEAGLQQRLKYLDEVSKKAKKNIDSKKIIEINGERNSYSEWKEKIQQNIKALEALLINIDINALYAEIGSADNSFKLLQIHLKLLQIEPYFPQNKTYDAIATLREPLNSKCEEYGLNASLLNDEQKQIQICEAELKRLQSLDTKKVLEPENDKIIQALDTFLEHKIFSETLLQAQETKQNSSIKQPGQTITTWPLLQHDLKKLRKEKLFDDRIDAVENIIPEGNKDYVFRRTNIRKVLRECEKHTDVVYRDVEKLLKAVIDFRSYFVARGIFSSWRSNKTTGPQLEAMRAALIEAQQKLADELLNSAQKQVLKSALNFAISSLQRRIEHLSKEEQKKLQDFGIKLTEIKNKINDITVYSAIPTNKELPDDQKEQVNTQPAEQNDPLALEKKEITERKQQLVKEANSFAETALQGKEELLHIVEQIGEGAYGKVFLCEYKPDPKNPCPLLDELCVRVEQEDGSVRLLVVMKVVKEGKIDSLLTSAKQKEELAKYLAFDEEAAVGYKLSDGQHLEEKKPSYNLTYPVYYNNEMAILSRYAIEGSANNFLDALKVHKPSSSDEAPASEGEPANIEHLKPVEKKMVGECKDFVKRDMDILLVQMMDSFMSGVHAFHKKGLIHDDIAARNCLVSTFNNQEVKIELADYGMSQPVHADGFVFPKPGTEGTPFRWASLNRIEQLAVDVDKGGYHTGYTQLADVHAAKVTLMEMLASVAVGAQGAMDSMYLTTKNEGVVGFVAKAYQGNSESILNTYYERLKNAGVDNEKIAQIFTRFESYLTSSPEDQWILAGRKFDRNEIDKFLEQDYADFIAKNEAFVEAKFYEIENAYTNATSEQERAQLLLSLERLQKITVSPAFKQGLVYQRFLELLASLFHADIQPKKAEEVVADNNTSPIQNEKQNEATYDADAIANYKAAFSTCKKLFKENIRYYHFLFEKFNIIPTDFSFLSKAKKTLESNYELFESFKEFIKTDDFAELPAEDKRELEKLKIKLTKQYERYQEYLVNQINRNQKKPDVLQQLQEVVLSKELLETLQGCLDVKVVDLHKILAKHQVKEPGLVIRTEPASFAAEKAAQSPLAKTENEHIARWQSKLQRRSKLFETQDDTLISKVISSAKVRKETAELIHIEPTSKKTTGFGFNLNLRSQELTYSVNSAAPAKDKVKIDAKAMANQVWQLGFSKIEVAMPKSAASYAEFKKAFLSELDEIAKGKRAIEVIILADGKQNQVFVGSNNDNVPAPENNSRFGVKK